MSRARRGAVGGARRRLGQVVGDLLAPVVDITSPASQSILGETFTVNGTFVTPVDEAPVVRLQSPPSGSLVDETFTVTGTWSLTSAPPPAPPVSAYPSTTRYPSTTTYPRSA